MTEQRALDIIAAMGADSARWPDDERAGVLALVAQPAVAAAASLDALLGDWACADVAGAPFVAARLVPAPVVVSARPLRRWLAAGAMAAAVAAAVVLTPMSAVSPPKPAAQVAAVFPSPCRRRRRAATTSAMPSSLMCLRRPLMRML